MRKKKGFNAKKFVMRTTLAVLTGTIYLSVTGCGEKTARIEQNQLELQKLMQINTQQMTDSRKRIEDKQGQLHVAMEDVQDGAKGQANDVIAAIVQEHAALQDILLIHQQLTNSIIGIEQNQQGLQSAIGNLDINIQRADESTVGLE
jgi:hypothetical protein